MIVVLERSLSSCSITFANQPATGESKKERILIKLLLHVYYLYRHHTSLKGFDLAERTEWPIATLL